MPLSIFDERSALVAGLQLILASGTSDNLIIDTGTQDRRIDSIICTSTDTIDHDVQIKVNYTSGPQVIGSVHVPAGAGYGGVAAVEGMLTLSVSPIAGILLGPGSQLFVRALVPVTTALAVDVLVQGGTF